MLGFLWVLLVILKLAGVISWSWWIVMFPLIVIFIGSFIQVLLSEGNKSK
jgi:hypothetical protein